MTIATVLAVLGVNAVFYSVLMFCFEWLNSGGKFRSFLAQVLLLLSFPGVLLYHTAFEHVAKIEAKAVQKREDRLRYLVRAWHRPARYEIEQYDLDCEGFALEDGTFDLRAWKEHELSRNK